MAYIALKRMKVGEDYLEPGDVVPGAEDWKNLSSYISAGYVAGFPDAASEGGERLNHPAGQALRYKQAPEFAREELEEMTKDELQDLVDEREVEVQGTGASGNVLKSDLVAALLRA